MPKIIINLITVIVSFGLSVLFMDLMFLYFFLNIGDISLSLFSNYLAFTITEFDRVLVWFFPIFIIYPIIKKGITFSKNILLYTVIGLIAIFSSIILGVLVAIITWSPDDPTLYLPNYFLIQPFDYYWSLFIIAAIIITILVIFKREGN
jgi:hypothetical protein